MIKRSAGRMADQLRGYSFVPNVSRYAEGSCLVKSGFTQVLCTATFEDRVPAFLKGKQSGWVTAEYGMLPRATHSRTEREASKGKQSGRTHEIQRLIGRALRASLDLEALGERQFKIDCDVLQADGGTRTAAISGGFVALALAIKKLRQNRTLVRNPLEYYVAAVSCGLIDRNLLLDLDYNEDSQADVDGNFVVLSSGAIVEVQATAEKRALPPEKMIEMLQLAVQGCKAIFQLQRDIIGDIQ